MPVTVSPTTTTVVTTDTGVAVYVTAPGAAPTGYLSGNGMYDLQMDVVNGVDTAVGAAGFPIQSFSRAITLTGSGESGGRVGGWRLAGSALATIDRGVDILGQVGPTQTYGTAGAKITVPQSVRVRGGGSNQKSGTGKANTWIVDTVANDALVQLGHQARLEDLAVTNRSATGWGITITNDKSRIDNVLVQGCQGDGIHYITNGVDGCITSGGGAQANAGTGASILGSNATDPPNALLFQGWKAQGNQLHQLLYDSTDAISGPNVGGKSHHFDTCDFQGPGTFTATTPLVELRGMQGAQFDTAYFETTGGGSAFPALRIDAGGAGHGGRISMNITFSKPRFHTGHTGTTPAVYIDNAQGIEIDLPTFDVNYTPTVSQPLVFLGANAKGCRIRIGPQPGLSNPDPSAQVVDNGVGNDVRVWSYTLNDYVELSASTHAALAGGNSGSAKTLSMSNGNFQSWSVNTNCTFTMPSGTGMITGVEYTFRLKLTQSGGSNTATFTGVKWPVAAVYVLSTANGSIDFVRFTSVDAGATWYGFTEGKAMA